MLKSKPRDDRFPDHIISQTGIHTPKSGVLFHQVLASSLPQSDRISNNIYELPIHIEVFNKNTILSQYPHRYSQEKNNKPCKMTQMAKCKNRYLTFLHLRR